MFALQHSQMSHWEALSVSAGFWRVAGAIGSDVASSTLFLASDSIDDEVYGSY